MRVAVVSSRNQPGFPERNLLDHLAWVRRAAGKGARLVLFPELSLCGYSMAPFLRDMGMTLRSAPCRDVARAARELGIFVAFGLPLRRGRKLYISHALVGPSGLVGHYEEVHLAGGAQGEGRVFSPGSEFRVFEVDGVALGINICFDGRHPASSLCLAHLGAEIILHPHGNTVGGLGLNPRDWTAKKRAYLGPRAADTCTYMLICNSMGDVHDKGGQQRRFSGGALILGPDGRFVARSPSAARRPHMVVADLDIAGLRRKRLSSHFAHRRPDAYIRALSQT